MTKATDHNPNNPPAGGSARSGETNIVVLVEHNPEIVLLDEGKRDLLFENIEQEVSNFEHDMTTAKGRDATKALAFKITKTKTAVKAARLKLTEDARLMVKKVNESGNIITERLEALTDRARAPLTAWEEADDARLEACKTTLERFRQAAIVPLDATAAGLRARINEVVAESMDENHWQGMLELASKARETALEALKAALAIVEQKEADAAELVRLREQAAAREAEIEQERLAREERERQETEARERAESEARAAEEAKAREAQDEADREAEQARQEQEATDAAEQQRIASEQAATAAAERARAEEAERAAAEAAETQRAHAAELEAANRAREEAEERERQRVAAEEAAAAERAKLEANQARRRMVKTEAKQAIMSCGANEDAAQKIVLAIIAGEIPRVLLDFSARGLDETKPEGAML